MITMPHDLGRGRRRSGRDGAGNRRGGDRAAWPGRFAAAPGAPAGSPPRRVARRLRRHAATPRPAAKRPAHPPRAPRRASGAGVRRSGASCPPMPSSGGRSRLTALVGAGGPSSASAVAGLEASRAGVAERLRRAAAGAGACGCLPAPSSVGVGRPGVVEWSTMGVRGGSPSDRPDPDRGGTVQDASRTPQAEPHSRQERSAGTAGRSGRREQPAGVVGGNSRQEWSAGTAGRSGRREQQAGAVGRNRRQEWSAGTAGRSGRCEPPAGAVGANRRQERSAGTAGRSGRREQQAGVVGANRRQERSGEQPAGAAGNTAAPAGRSPGRGGALRAVARGGLRRARRGPRSRWPTDA